MIISGSFPIRWLLFDMHSFNYNHLMRKMVDDNHVTWCIQLSEGGHGGKIRRCSHLRCSHLRFRLDFEQRHLRFISKTLRGHLLIQETAGQRRPRRCSRPAPRVSGVTSNLPTKILPAKIAWLKLSWKIPMDMRIPRLKIKILLESHPLKSRILVRRLAVQGKQNSQETRGASSAGALLSKSSPTYEYLKLW